MRAKLFPTDLKEREWREFPADGFGVKVAGLIHRKDWPADNGMPLGAIGTGCIDLETDGTLGYCTIFNSHVPRRGPINLPFLGLSVHDVQTKYVESWVLSTRGFTHEMDTRGYMGTPKRACPAKDIHYWGHYPVADLEYDLDGPIGAGLRAWAPFIPGDVAVSNTPGLVFEVRLRNVGDTHRRGTLAFSFPGPSIQETAGHHHFEHSKVYGTFAGVRVSNGQGQEYSLGIVNAGDKFRTGGDFGTDGNYWSNFSGIAQYYGSFPGIPEELGQAGASVAVEFELAAGQEKTIRFVLAWHSPTWRGGGTPISGGNEYFHKYAERFKDSNETAEFLARNHESLLRRILAWQEVIYSEPSLPPWLRESLINVLHLIPEDGFWAQARAPIGQWCRKEDGLFAMNECPRGCPQTECIPCSFYGNIPLVYFFPELATSTLRAYKAYQYPAGNAPWVFGGCTAACPTPPCEVALPSPGYLKRPQTTLDGPCYVDMIERIWLRTGDRALLEEFYDSLKRNTIFTMNLCPEAGAAGIVSLPTGNDANDWMEFCDNMYGIVPHVGGVHLANLRMSARVAAVMGDTAFAGQCDGWFRQGSGAMEEHTWNGKYYLLYHEPSSGRKCDVIMGCQLDGEWMVKFHGLQSAFDPERVKTVLETLKTTNNFPHGATVFRVPEGSDFKPGNWGDNVHIPSSFVLAATYLYYGDRQFGLDLARRTVRAYEIENRATWNGMLVIRGGDASFVWGMEYYQNLMLWCLPAAIESTDLAGACRKGGLVDRILEAAKA
jgi:uncharacterized protein (DUF608 family)